MTSGTYILYSVIVGFFPGGNNVVPDPDQHHMTLVSKAACETAAAILIPNPDRIEDGKRIIEVNVKPGKYTHFVVCLPQGD